MKKTSILALLLLTVILTYGQGKLILVGGGTERSGTTAWNYAPYAWGINQAANKKVAIIGFGAESDSWLRTYFTSNGATACSYFDISTTQTANAQATYDNLMAFDMFFFKGGDQYDYYNTYKNTMVAEAVVNKFNAGGVIAGTSAGMAILSSVIYTAQYSSITAPEGMANILNANIVLQNDFFPFLSGVIVDTHFAERARFGRLLAFMARWKRDNNQNTMGIGVDDLTAFCIDQNNVGTAYGTGAVNIFVVEDESNFSPTETQLAINNIKVIQLLHGQTFNLTDKTFTGSYSQQSTPILTGETANHVTILTGSNSYGVNLDAINRFVNNYGQASDTVHIFTGSSTSLATTYATQIQNSGGRTAIYQAISQNGTNPAMEGAIQRAGKIMIVDNTFATFNSFLSTANGTLLKGKLKRSGAINMFIGDNCRFAGKIVVENYTTDGAAYYGEMTFPEGIGIFETSVIMPNSFLSTDYRENTAVAVPYAVAKHNLAYGIWLVPGSHAEYRVENGNTALAFYGSYPGIVLKNSGTGYGLSQHTSTGTGGTPRQIAGFEQMTMHSVPNQGSFVMGTLSGLENNQIENRNLRIFPNPATDVFFIDMDKKYDYSIYNLRGQLVMHGNDIKPETPVQIHHFEKGIYLIKVTIGHENFQTKLMVP